MVELWEVDQMEKAAAKPPVEGDVVYIESIYNGKYEITTQVEKVLGYVSDRASWIVEVCLGLSKHSRRLQGEDYAPPSKVLIKKNGTIWYLVKS